MSYSVLKTTITPQLYAFIITLLLSGCYTVVDDGASKPKTVHPDPPMEEPRFFGEAMTIRGVVQKNDRGCTYDALCYLVVEDGRRNRFSITYGGGRGFRCDFMGSGVSRITPGTRVEVYAKCRRGNCTVCEGDDNYYVRRIGRIR